MNYGDELISVEFTKTLDPDKKYELPNGKYSEYVENPNWNYDFQKYRKRIENKVIESSVLSQFRTLGTDFKSYKDSTEESIKSSQETSKDIEEKNEKALKEFRRYNFIGLISIFIAGVVLVITTWHLIESTHEKIDAAYNLIKQYDDQSVDFRSFARFIKASSTTTSSVIDYFTQLGLYI